MDSLRWKVESNTLDVLQEMFKLVGLDMTTKEIAEYCKEPEWYWQHTWTSKEESEFKEWLINYYVTTCKASKKLAERTAPWFILNYGWKTKEK